MLKFIVDWSLAQICEHSLLQYSVQDVSAWKESFTLILIEVTYYKCILSAPFYNFFPAENCKPNYVHFALSS